MIQESFSNIPKQRDGCQRSSNVTRWCFRIQISQTSILIFRPVSAEFVYMLLPTAILRNIAMNITFSFYQRMCMVFIDIIYSIILEIIIKY